jgi:L-rhamnose mutarotase
LQGLAAVGIIDMKIFLLGRRMFMYMTATDEFDPDRDFPRYVEQNPQAAEWDELMRTFQRQVPEAQDGEWWANMEMVFDLQLHI